MENKTPQTQEQIMQELLENSRKTKNYIKWHLIITVVIVLIPFLVALIAVPFAFNLLGQSFKG